MSQFTTMAEAQKTAEQINAYGPFIGGGVMPVTDNRETSGIFVYSWGGPFPAPSDGEKLPYYFRFANGNRENNCGMVLDLMAAFPQTWPIQLMQMTPATVYNWPV